jgi:hypothetical protein
MKKRCMQTTSVIKSFCTRKKNRKNVSANASQSFISCKKSSTRSLRLSTVCKNKKKRMKEKCCNKKSRSLEIRIKMSEKK